MSALRMKANVSLKRPRQFGGQDAPREVAAMKLGLRSCLVPDGGVSINLLGLRFPSLQLQTAQPHRLGCPRQTSIAAVACYRTVLSEPLALVAFARGKTLPQSL